MDDDWNVTFDRAYPSLLFGPSGVEVDYFASAPNGPFKYYKPTILLYPDCLNYTHDQSIYPILDILPDASYSDGRLIARMLINTDTIESSGDFWTRVDRTGGILHFCVRMDLYNERDISMATESTLIVMNVDTTITFEVTGVNYTNEVLAATEQEVRVEYPLDVFFCDDANAEVTPAPTLFPGDVLQVCVATKDTDDAYVSDVHAVGFYNSLVSSIPYEVIDSEGDATNLQTLKVCDERTGICNIRTVTFSALYQADTDLDGDIEDVTVATSMAGTAVLKFGNPTNSQGPKRRRIAKNTVTGFDIDLGGYLERRPADKGLGSEDALASTNHHGPTVLFDGLSIGVGAVIAALVAVVVGLVVHQHRRKSAPQVGRQEPTETAATTANGRAMI